MHDLDLDYQLLHVMSVTCVAAQDVVPMNYAAALPDVIPIDSLAALPATAPAQIPPLPSASYPAVCTHQRTGQHYAII
jgi:hypothetical protein